MAPKGLPLLRLLLLWGALGTYAALWIWFFYRIWNAGINDDSAPDLSATAAYVISALGGVLGTFFAAALGIQRKDPNVDANKLGVGRTLLGQDPEAPHAPGASFGTFAVWIYALIGVWALLTVLVYQVQSPPSVKAMATAFASLVFALFSAALAPGQASTPQVPQPNP